MPDYEELCSTYLNARKSGNHSHADFLMLETLDQCVRTVLGGELAKYYELLQSNPAMNAEMIKYVQHRTGHNLMSESNHDSSSRLRRLFKNPIKILSKLEWIYSRAIIRLLPSAFRNQNISFTTVGEKHTWMYDFYTVEQLLLKVGFIDIQRKTFNTSNIKNFPYEPLDQTKDGQPRKGSESMYIEAIKP